MNYFLFVVFFLVTLVADLPSFCFKKVAYLGGMRVMAVGAFSFFQRCMHHRFAESDLPFFVTGKTHLIARILEDRLWDYAVTKVALLAFLLLDGSVHIPHLQVLIGEFLVAIQTLFALKASPSRGRSTGGEVDSGAQEKEYSRQDIDAFSL